MLSQKNIKPLKYLGQNFLVDKNVIKKIINIAALKRDDYVLEVGPGTGVLTKEIAQKVKLVIAVEKDKRLSEKLKKEILTDFKNVKIINKDVLTLNSNFIQKTFENKKYKIISNLPFYLTSHFIRKFLEIKFPPQEMILIIQKEVAQRICAQSPKMNILAVFVQLLGEVKLIDYISKNSFKPKPKVDSAIIKIKPFHKRFSPSFYKLLINIIKSGYSHPRKQIISNLSNELKLNKEKIKSILLKTNIQPFQRAENLSISEWLKLTQNITQNKYFYTSKKYNNK